MKKLLSLIAAAALLPAVCFGQNNPFTKINSLPIRNSPESTDSIPASDAAGTTWRIQFSKFVGSGGSGLPDMTGNSGKILTNNGTSASWTASFPISGITGMNANAAAFLVTPSSANLRALITDEVGTGAAYFVGGAAGTPASINLSNGTALPGATGISGFVAQANLGTGSGGAGLKFLADDQTYKTIDALPSQGGNSGKFLTTNGTIAGWVTVAGGGDALTTQPLSQFAPTTSDQLAIVLTNESGTTGGFLRQGSPVMTGAPVLGTDPTGIHFSVTGTSGNGFFEAIPQSVAPTTPTSGRIRLYSNSVGQLTWLNSAGFTASLDTLALTGNANFTLPNKSGAILVGDDNNLAGGTALTVGKQYYDTLSANRTVTFTGTPVAGGNATVLRLNVTTASTLTFPSAIRVASSSPTPITSLPLPIGLQVLSFTWSNSAWNLVDTVADTSGLVPSSRIVAGHALTDDVVIDGSDLVFTDVTSNNATTGQHGFLPKLSGVNTQYMDGSGAWSVPPGAGTPPTGTGFRHVTSGAEDPASVGETGTGSVVRAILPTIAGEINNAALSLSGVISVAVNNDQHNWAPTGFSTTFVIRADASATDRTITGIAGGTAGRVIQITNISASANIILANASTSSSSNNRFDIGGDFIISPSKSTLLRYDIASNRWRTISGASLVGDVAAPGNAKFYGTNSTGVKGYQDLSPDTINVLVGDGSGAIADSGIDPADVLTINNLGTLPDHSIPMSRIDATDIDISTTLSGSTYTLAPGKNYYGDITGNKTFAFSPAFTNADVPTTVRLHITGGGTWTVPTLIREGASGSTTTVVVGSTGYFTTTFLKTGAGNLRMIDDIADLLPVAIGIAASDETTALTTGTAKTTFRMPYAMTVTGVRATLTTAQASGSIFTVDLKEGGTTILSTKITVDNTEKTSTTAVTPAVISDTALADDAEITVDIDQIGTSGATGLKIWLIGGR